MAYTTTASLAVAVLLSSTILFAEAEAKGKGSKSKSDSIEYHSFKGARAIDGDTFRYLGKRYRIRQYNAPELGTRGATAATKSLQRKIDSGEYLWGRVATDVYGRSVVREQRQR